MTETEKNKNKRDQWNQELALWKDKQDWWIFIQINKEKKERTQTHKIRNERGEVTMDITEKHDCKKIL